MLGCYAFKTDPVPFMEMLRNAAVAGTFYPGEQQSLSKLVDTLLEQAHCDEPCPKVIIAPHAGYIYSGSVAAQAYSRLKNALIRSSVLSCLGPRIG